MPNNINTKNWIRASVLLCLLSFPSTLLSQSSVLGTSTVQNGVTQSAVVTHRPSYPRVQVYSQPQAYPQVQRYQQVQNYPQVQNYARTQVYPQLATPQQAAVANSVTDSAEKNYSGTWRLSLSAGQQQQRKAAIESAISSFGRFQQGKARQVMDRLTSPENQLQIVDSGDQIRMTRMGRAVTIALNGQPVAVNLGQQNASMQAVKRDGKLIVVSSMANATKTTTYELSADGRQLKQTVDMSGGRLPTPIQYTNTYIR